LTADAVVLGDIDFGRAESEINARLSIV
jgi:hypothetical protein